MINANDISPAFAELLCAAGWTPSRSVGIDPSIRGLEREGFELNELAAAVPDSFFGLEVYLPAAGISPYSHHLKFDPATISGEFDRTIGWSEKLGVQLFPVAEVIKGGNVVWVGDDRRMYIGFEFGLYLLGGSLREGLDQLAFPDRMPPMCAP